MTTKIGCRTKRWGDYWLKTCVTERGAYWHVKTSKAASYENVIGTLDLKRQGPFLAVTLIEVDPKHQRAHLGTKLYETAVAFACKEGIPLASDTMRSRFAEAFWRKQKAKGRAVCRDAVSDDDRGTVYKSPMYVLNRDLERGHITRAKYDAIVAKLPVPEDENYWSCPQYVVQAPCSTRSLARIRQRRRRR